MNKIDIKMPRVGTNDNFVTLGKWRVKEGTFVNKGDLIATVETTKETQDIKVEASGYIYFLKKENEDAEVESVIAVLTEDQQEESALKKENTNEKAADVKITNKAAKLAQEHGIDISSIVTDKIIREKDIMELINAKSSKFTRSKGNDIIIVSGGGVAKMCIDILRSVGGYNICGITDPNLPVGTEVLGVPVIGNDDILEEKFKKGHKTAINAIGGIANDNKSNLFNLRKKTFEKIQAQGYFMPNIIHPGAMIESSVTMGEGNLVLAGASIGSDAKIADDCIINTGAVVSHDCVIESHCKISPGATLAGNVHVGENSLIGMGVTVYIGVKIGKNVIISNGKNIFTDVPDNTIIK